MLQESLAAIGPQAYPAAWGASKKKRSNAALNALCEIEGKPVPHPRINGGSGPVCRRRDASARHCSFMNDAQHTAEPRTSQQ